MGDRRKIHWKKWEVLCKPKEEGGGMGFKGLCKFNEALLAKQVWRLVHDKHSLFYKVLKQCISLTSPFLKLLYLLDLLLGKAF